MTPSDTRSNAFRIPLLPGVMTAQDHQHFDLCNVVLYT